ncbi:MAG: TonB-dependent receptor [Verrucomicrobia bacterium]|nr:TonB-dependent receptor [Verrucomicrobiota bacterium]
MKQIPLGSTCALFFVVGIALSGFAPTPVPAADAMSGSAQSTGTIAGRVGNAATKSYLEGAVVELVGTGRTVVTDRDGAYQFTGVAAGSAALSYSFTGLDAQQVTVSVGAGQRVVRDVELTSAIYQLEKFTVAGEREGTAKAETLQRQAPNVKAIVSSDTFGNVADGNIGDMLQHMAGITANYNGPDVRSVSIRGVRGDLNSVTMDGQQVASSQSAGTGRQFEFEQASLNNVESIEVTKAPTPDMDGASIGGSINLVTKSAFDRAAARIFTYTIGVASLFPGAENRPVGEWTGKWRQPVTGFGPSMNFSYSDVIGANRNIGITLTGLVHSQPGHTSLINQSYERKNEPGPVFNYSTSRLLTYGGSRGRIATGAKIDYKLSERTVITFNTSYNFFHENNLSPTMALTTVGVPTAATPQVLAVVSANGERIGGGYIHPNYADGITRVFPHPTLSFSNLSVTGNDKAGRTYLFAPSVRHRFDGLNIDYSLSYSNSATYYDVSHDNEKVSGPATGTVTMRLNNVGWWADNSTGDPFPTIRQTAGPNMYDIGNYGNLILTQNDRRGYDKILGGKFDLRKELNLALPMYVKSGFLYKEQSRKIWNTNRRYNWAGADGIVGNADDARDLRQFGLSRGPTTDEDRYFVSRGEGAPPWPDTYKIAAHQNANPGMWREDVAFGAQADAQALRMITERIGAVYAMGNVRLRQLSVLAGVRFEDTRLKGQGPLTYLSPEERARRAAWVGPVTDDETRRRAFAQYGTRKTNRGSYNVVLPGVHLKYEPLPGFVTRASWSTGVGRPPFGSIIPLDTVNDDTRRVTRSNPDLNPQYAHNYDVTAEYYFRPQGMISAGAFRKKISDYIFTDSSQVIGSGQDNGFDGEYVGYALTTQANGGFAKIEGIEFNYQQQLSFLRGWAKGFGVNANYTSLKTEGDYGGTTVLTSNSLAGFLNKSGNIGLNYRGFGWDLRLQAVYRGRYLNTNSTIPALVQYQVAKTSWSWKSRYAFSRRVTVFFDLENIFAVPLDNRYALYKGRTASYRIFPTKMVLGLTGRL